jgi:hypothetical protein
MFVSMVDLNQKRMVLNNVLSVINNIQIIMPVEFYFSTWEKFVATAKHLL